MSIPIVAIEEHYEAFFVWHHARQARWLPATDSVLLHIDEHADLRLPASRAELPEQNDPDAAARYAYKQLNISSFIWPAVHAGLFDRVYWMRRQHEPDVGGPRRVALSFDAGRFPAAWTKRDIAQSAPSELASNEVACHYAPIDPASELQPITSWVLDIDLDYFIANSPADRPASRLHLEESFARQVVENPYHWMNTEGFPFQIEQDDDGQWVMDWFVEGPQGSPRKLPPPQPLDESLQQLGAFLDRLAVEPSLVTICRSEYSGFTPKPLVHEIEHGVRDLLSARYSLREHSLNHLLPAGWKVPPRLLRTFPWR